MRYSICTQSCASVPPAPACKVMIALSESYLPFKSASSLKCSILSVKPAISAFTLSISLSSSASSASSIRTFTSSTSALTFSNFWIFVSSIFNSRLTSPACAILSQKPSECCSFVRTSTRAFRLPKSKASATILRVSSNSFILFF